MAHLVSIAFTPANVERHPTDRYARVPTNLARLVEQRGIEGDVKGRGGRRQLNLMFAEVVAQLADEDFHTDPGELGEQLVVAGLGVTMLPVGARLHIGSEAIVEVTMPREPCNRFARVQGQPMELGIGRIGVMARVVRGGNIAVGDTVELASAVASEGVTS
jgi:MOSC domain-containing protein YiiM